jgi:hypothetical protein
VDGKDGMKLYDLPTSLKDDVMTLTCGELLGSGVSRQVYLYVPNPTDTVIKLQTDTRFQNQREWAVLESVKEAPELRKWFAPCICISDLGVWMLQERTTPVTLAELNRDVPKVPRFFTDLKAGNWGRIGKRYVCHDYGTALTTENGLTTRLKVAKWWD